MGGALSKANPMAAAAPLPMRFGPTGPLRATVRSQAISPSHTAPATIPSRRDHHIVVSFAVAGLRALEPIGIDDMGCADTRFPGIAARLARLSGSEERR
jgi:5-enolpyruvylshikimate-3-phosphate synthase